MPWYLPPRSDSTPSRVHLRRPLTRAEERAVALLSEGLEKRMTYRQLGEALGVAPRTAMNHIKNAGEKIPGDLPLRLKVVNWYRGGNTVWLRIRRARSDADADG